MMLALTSRQKQDLGSVRGFLLSKCRCSSYTETGECEEHRERTRIDHWLSSGSVAIIVQDGFASYSAPGIPAIHDPGVHTMTLRLPAFCLAVLMVTVAVAQDAAKTQKLTAKAMTFEVPTSWKSVPPRTMREVQLKLDPVTGETTPGDLSIYVFPGGAGGVKANIERWQGQFKDADGKTPPIESKELKGKNVDVTRVTCAGTFTDPFGGAGPQKGFRMIVAMIQAPDSAYFFKLVGPEKTVKAAEKDFDAMIASMNLK